MILGHITSTYLIGDLLKRTRFRVHLPTLIFGAMLPDLVDKSFAFFCSYPGRGAAHSVVILTLAFFLLSRFTKHKKYRHIVFTVYAGSLLHLVQDSASPEVLFWPFLDSWNVSPSLSFYEKLNLFYLDRSVPGQWWIELVSAFYLLSSLVIKLLASLSKRYSPAPQASQSFNVET